jgi:hypothetical protein
MIVPDAKVAKRYGVCIRTIKRWDANPDLGFPNRIDINGRCYRDSNQLDAWDRENSLRAAQRASELKASK